MNKTAPIALNQMTGTFYYNMTTTDAELLHSWMTLFSGCNFMIGLIGFLPNLSIVYITAKHKRLRKANYGWMLALTCLFDMVHELSTIAPLFFHLNRWSIPLLGCFLLQWYDLFALTMVYQYLFAIAVDRLVAILFPIWYKNIMERPTHRLILVYTTVFALHSAFLMQFYLRYVLNAPDRPVFCLVADYSSKPWDTGGLSPYGVSAFYYHGVAINVTTILIYTGMWLLLACGIKCHANRRIFKSLSVITLSCFLFWVLPLGMGKFVLSSIPNIGRVTQITAQMFAGIGVRISGIMNAPILFICSADYRATMVAEFRVLTPLGNMFEPNTSVLRVSSVAVAPANIQQRIENLDEN